MSDIDSKLQQSAEIVARAIREYQPYAIVAMVSGGNDSMTAYHAARVLNVPLTHLLHGVTGTGIPETTQFVRGLGEACGLSYIEANAGNAYEEYVLRKGFFGRGKDAHTYAYHILKDRRFRHTLSTNIRQGRRGRTILLINGARREESLNRSKHTGLDAIRKDGNNVWVNIINEWTKAECSQFLADVKRNPVTEILCRSGECMCGTMQSHEARREAAYWYPHWGRWLDDLEQRVLARGFWWKWGDDVPQAVEQMRKGQLSLLGETLPMCTSCE